MAEDLDVPLNLTYPLLIFLLLLDRPLCPNGMRTVGRWCSTPCTEAKETLDYVPELVMDRYFVLATVAPSQYSSFTSPPSLFFPILFHLRRCQFPLPRQIKDLLFPSPHPY